MDSAPGASQRLVDVVLRRDPGAREHADAGHLRYDPEKHASHRLVYGGHDPGVCARYHGAQAEWLLGYPEQGARKHR